MPEYVRALRKHDCPDQPVEMHDEVLPDRAVPRRVETFGDTPAMAELRATAAAESRGEIELFGSTQIEFKTAFRAATPS